MSKARSPRDVCSTTIGTRGLIGAPVYRSPSAAFFPLQIQAPNVRPETVAAFWERAHRELIGVNPRRGATDGKGSNAWRAYRRIDAGRRPPHRRQGAGPYRGSAL